MADLRSFGPNNTAENGREYADAAEFVAKVDNSAWDFATVCSSCHVGGGLTTADKEGTRYSQRPIFQGQSAPLNAYDYTVYEYWMGPADMAANPLNPQYANGAPAHYVNDLGMNNHLNSDGSMVDTDSNPATGKFPGFAPGLAPWAYPYPIDMNGDGDYDDVAMGDNPNFMMPNVRELDCMFCHMEGYNNIISSVAVQMGALNAAPSMGAGLLNMFTQSYIPGVVETMSVNGPMGPMNVAYLPGSTVGKIKGNPPSDNCRLCHSPTTMENFSDMFDKFLAASPMEFNPGSPFAGPTGLAMPGYDLNAAFVNPAMATMSPTVYGQPNGSWVYGDGSNAGGPFNGLFPMALFQTYKNVVPLNPMAGEMGGNNLPGSGPIYFAGGDTFDQQALKKATIPFPRADFFKRGDIWDNNTQEVHHSLECAGCHMDTNAANKDQCDPGRGYARLGGVESGAFGAQDSRNSVKGCENCHITGKSDAGDAIETYGAPNPSVKHAAAGLTANIVNAIGASGGFKGNHLDVVDCTVCHMKKQSMAVRALDCTSGNRYPTMIGFQSYKGMMAMFTDPMGLKDVPASAFPLAGLPPYPKEMFVNEMVEWQPLRGWWQNGPQFLDAAKTIPNPDYRRKIYNINMITAILFDNDGNFDANGDGATGVEADAQAHDGALGFDPWIQRDLKAGMTFADTGFATVPVGFGDPMNPANPYGMVYSQASANGFNPATGWDYVGVYGGNVMFTNPEQINAYQSFRSTMNPVKPWDETKLTIFGGPFQVTHNVVDTSINALGKGGNCNACHDAASEFFSGGYDMTGSAVPTGNSVDMSGANDITQANGSMVMDLSAYNMMQRPVVDYEIVADAADLVTGGEAQSKTGAIHEVEFEEHGCWDAATKTFTLNGVNGCSNGTYARTTDMSRAEFLYFDQADAHARAAALETNRTLADYVAAPVAVIAAATPATVEIGSTVNLVADASVNTVGEVSYSWICNDTAGEVLSGATAAKTFSKLGTWTLTLKVTNADGTVAQVAKQVTVTAPVALEDIALTSSNPAGQINTVTFSNLTMPHTMLYIIWGDGTKQQVLDTNASAAVDHKFLMYAKYDKGTYYEYNTTLYVYNGSAKVAVKQAKIQINK